MILSLEGILGNRLPIQDLERLWLESSCLYAVYDDNMLEDTEWDHLGRELWDRRSELSPYFAHACELSWPVTEDHPGENPLKTAMGVKWDVGLPQIVSYGIKTEGAAHRIALWKQRLDSLRGWQERKERMGAIHRENNARREAKNAQRRASRRRLTGTSPNATT